VASKGVSADVASKPPTSCDARFSKVRAEVQRGLILLALEFPPDPSERGPRQNPDPGGELGVALGTIGARPDAGASLFEKEGGGPCDHLTLS